MAPKPSPEPAMKIFSALASLAFVFSLSAAPALAGDLKSTEITSKKASSHDHGEKACCKKEAKDTASVASSEKECCKKDGDCCKKGEHKGEHKDGAECCKKHAKGEKQACCNKHAAGEPQKCCKKGEHKDG
jgi:hypothetical protein